VKWAVSNKIPFVARSGGHGYTSTLSSLAGLNSIIINLRQLNTVTISKTTNTAILSAGVTTEEVVAAAQAAKKHILTGVCNSVGVISSYLGGGIGDLSALYGLGVDNMISARLITASGEVITVSKDENSDLWWGLRGAGHNFGIVSEMVVKTHEQVNRGMHWGGNLAYAGTEENLRVFVDEGIKKMGFGEGKPIGCTMVWARVPPAFEVSLSKLTFNTYTTIFISFCFSEYTQFVCSFFTLALQKHSFIYSTNITHKN
jgi:hypothetical protein